MISSRFSISLIFIFPILLWVTFADEINFDPPNLTPELKETSWDGFTSVIWEYVNNKSAIFSKDKNTLVLHCNASYPIEWNITGIIRQPEFIKIQPYQRQILNNGKDFLFILKLFIFFDANEPNTLSSSRITCQSVKNPSELKSSLGVFLSGPTLLVNSGQLITVKNSKLIPCATTDPTLEVNLFQSTPNGDVVKVSDTKYLYDPLEGFTFTEEVNGLYTCNVSKHSVTIMAEVTPILVPGTKFYPKESIIQAFSNENVQLECSSELNSVEIRKIEGDILLHFTNNASNSKLVQAGSPTNTTGIVGCFSHDNVEIWRWKLVFIAPPQLYLDNFEGEVDCISDDPTRSVSTVRCINPSHCEYMKHCLSNNSTNCNHKKQQVFKAIAPVAGCWIQSLNSGANCASVPYSHLNGLAECSVSGLKKYWYFFVGLDFRRYSNWEKANRNALVRMDEVKDILYTNDTSTFTCEATSFLFADSLTFSIEYANKTIQFLDRISYTNPSIENSRKIDEFNILGELKINLPIDAVAIHCHAPWLNSTEFMSVERRFVTKQLLEPEIIKPEVKVFTFFNGEKGRRLNCSAVGEPVYKWFKDGQMIEESSEFKIFYGSRGESLLEFTNVDDSVKGTYSCHSENSVGSDNVTFIVQDVQVDPSGNIVCKDKI